MFSDNYYSEKEPSEKIAFPFLFISRYVLSLNLNKSFTTRKVKNGSFNKLNLHIHKTLFLLYFPPSWRSLHVWNGTHPNPVSNFTNKKSLPESQDPFRLSGEIGRASCREGV